MVRTDKQCAQMLQHLDAIREAAQSDGFYPDLIFVERIRSWSEITGTMYVCSLIHTATKMGTSVRITIIYSEIISERIGHILRRNCLLKQVIEGKIKGEMDVTRRRGRRRKKLLDDLKDRKGYCHLKEEALARTMWRDRFGRGFGPVVRQTAY